MRATARSLGALCLAACGRVGFAALPDGSGDPGDDAVAARCPAGALLCDDFESGDLSRWTRVGRSSAGVMTTVTTTRARSGAFALEASSPPGMSDALAAAIVRVPTRSSGTLAARAWINLGSVMRDFNLVIVFDHHMTPQFLSAGGNGDGVWVSSDNNAADMLRDHASSTPTPPLDRWTCVELIFDFPGPAVSRILIRVDGVLVLDAPANDSAPEYTEVQVGVARADRIGFHVFVDDVAVANQPIGCT